MINGIAPAAQKHAEKCCCGGGKILSHVPVQAAGAMETRGRASMIWVPGGSFTMGSNDFYREERPTHQESVAGFWMDVHPVTNAEFREFVMATGYVTFSERQPDPVQYPDADPALLVPGSSVFTKPAGPVSLRDYRLWWAYVPGASWRNPDGPASTIDGRDDYPVVQITHEDASAYAAWAGKQLPTEGEWEFAARGGLEGATYAWGEEFAPAGRAMANTWQGRFPWENLNEDGYESRSPVHAFPPNGYGLYDMIGNVWEWTASYFAPPNGDGVKKSCCMPAEGGAGTGRRVIKGGSHLCAPNYCQRYRPAARLGEPADTATNHIGFRCVVREAEGRAV